MSNKMMLKTKSIQKENTTKSKVVMLSTNTMIPVVKPFSIEKCLLQQNVPKKKFKVIQTRKYRSKRALSFLEPPRLPFSTSLEEPHKVINNAEQNDGGINTSASMPSPSSNIVRNYFHMKNLLQRKKRDELPFPNSPILSYIEPRRVESKASEHSQVNSSITNISSITTTSKKLKRKQKQEKLIDKLENGAAIRSKESYSINLDLNPITSLRNVRLNPNVSEILFAFLNSDISMKRTSSDSSLTLRSLEKLLASRSFAAINHSSLYPSELNLSSDTFNIYSKRSAFATESESNNKNIKNTESIKNLENVMDYVKPLIAKHSESTKKIGNNSKYKYSWEDIENWVPPCEKSETTINTYRDKYFEQSKDIHCKIKYSWQVIGIGTQTSQELLDSFLKENDNLVPPEYECKIKYSWQIIGTATQVTLETDSSDNYWYGTIRVPNKHCYETVIETLNSEKHGQKKHIVVNNQNVQTCAEKGNQTEYTDCRVTYSWHKDIRKCLHK